MKKQLHTPEGVRDIYGIEYKQKKLIADDLSKAFKLFGYEAVETPCFEFYDIYDRDIGTTPGKDLYRFFDRDGNTLALRPDFTPGIMRCVATHFSEEKLPVRLTYQGDAFRKDHALTGRMHEMMQMGAELIGDNSPEADAEIIHLVITALKKCGLKEFQISLGNVEYFRGMCEEVGLSEDIVTELRNFISGKNIFGAEALLNELNINKDRINDFLKVVDLFGSEEVLDRSMLFAGNDKSIGAINRLRAIYEILKLYGDEEHVSFDMGLVSRYNYYTGMIFKAYTYGVGDCVATGGRYDRLLSHFGNDDPSVGFVLFIDEVIAALSAKDMLPEVKNDTVCVLYDEKAMDKAVRYVNELRKMDVSCLLLKWDDEKGKSFYVAYAKEKGFKELDRIGEKGKTILYKAE